MLISLRVTRRGEAAGQMHLLRLNASKDNAMYRSRSPWPGQWPPADYQCIVTGQGSLDCERAGGRAAHSERTVPSQRTN